MPTDKEMWKRILPRPLSTEKIKNALILWMEERQDALKVKGVLFPPAGLSQKNFIRLSKYQIWRHRDLWLRTFDYRHIGKAPFYLEVLSNAEDSEIVEINCLKDG